MILTVTLPWPSAALSPNARSQWGRIKAVTVARQEAHFITANMLEGDRIDAGALAVRMEFRPPANRRQDLDGMIARCKPYMDGVFDALGIDDNLIYEITARKCDPVKGGRVVIEIRRLEDR